MSTTEVKDLTTEKNETKSAKETERCGISKISRPPRTIVCPKSKIPMNISHTSRAQPTLNSNDNSTLIVTSTTPDETSVNETPRPSAKRFSRSQSPTKIPSRLETRKMNKSPNPLGSSSKLLDKQNLEKSNLPKKRRFVGIKKDTTDKQRKNALQPYEETSNIENKTQNQDKNQSETETSNSRSQITGDCVTRITTEIQKLLKKYGEICFKMLSERSELREFLEKPKEGKNETDLKEETIKLLETHRTKIYLDSDPENLVEEAKTFGISFLNEFSKEMSIYRKEMEKSRDRIRQFENNEEKKEREKKLLEDECAQLKKRQITLEADIHKLQSEEKQNNAEKAKIAQLQIQEAQMKQKRLGIDKQLKDMEKSLKNSQSLLAKTEKQRDSFEARLGELKKNFVAKEKENEAKIKGLTDKLNAINSELARERELKHNKNSDSQEKLIAELNSKLMERDSKIEALRRQKEEIIRVIDSGFFKGQNEMKSDDDSETHKTIVNSLTKKIEEIRAQYKSLEEKSENLHRQLTEIKFRGNEHSKNNEKSCRDDRVEDLEKQLSELRMNVHELTNRNEELEISLNQKQLAIEAQDRILRERTDVLKVRDEVISLINQSDSPEDGFLSLKKKNQRKSREQVDKQIAKKAENLQQLYSTLETKQMQITRLEQLVEQMEIQQERAQEQRTRLEKKIAQLQMAIHYKKSHRSRGWLSIL